MSTLDRERVSPERPKRGAAVLVARTGARVRTTEEDMQMNDYEEGDWRELLDMSELAPEKFADRKLDLLREQGRIMAAKDRARDELRTAVDRYHEGGHGRDARWRQKRARRIADASAELQEINLAMAELAELRKSHQRSKFSGDANGLKYVACHVVALLEQSNLGLAHELWMRAEVLAEERLPFGSELISNWCEQQAKKRDGAQSDV